MTTEPWAVGLTLLAVVLAALGPILLKKGADGFSLRPRKLLKNRNLLGGIFAYGLSTLVYIPALRGGELTVIYPIISLSFVMVAVLSVFLLGERMNWLKWAGIAFIIAGVSLIGVAA